MTEQELNGLIGEVEEDDTYLMRDKDDIVSINDPTYIHVKGHKRAFDFTPDVIFDLGGNVGVFAKYCRKLFPEATIISIEPDNVNIESFLKNTDGLGITLIKAGIGNGNLYKLPGAVNGSGESYMSKGLGYDRIEEIEGVKKTEVKSVFLSELVKKYVSDGQKYIVKIDIEGAENSLFKHEPSLQALLNADYITAELHYFAMTASQVLDVREFTENVLKRFEKTHRCWNDHIYFYAVKL